MKIFRKVTLKYLKQNKVRTFATLVGIILSAAMFCAITTFIASLNEYVSENAIYNTGDWQAGALNVDWETYERIRQQSEIEDIVAAQRVNYAEIEENQNSFKSYYYLLGANEDFMETMCSKLTSGRLPREELEILLPEKFAEETGIQFEIGDKMILEVGTRAYQSVILWQDDPYVFFSDVNNTEDFDREKTKIYTVVGFYDGISYKVESAAAPGYTVYTHFAEEEFRKESRMYDVYFNLKDGSKVYEFAEKNGLTEEQGVETTFNVEVIGVAGLLLQGSMGKMSVVLTGFVTGLILVGAIALIYNMFSISVSERTKQFGLLSSLGATPKQIGKIVLYEAYVLSVIGIPFGILAGIAGIWVALQHIGDRFQAFGFVIPMTIHVSMTAIVVAMIISLVTVLISAWIPAKRARKANIIETIRQNKEIYQAKKQEKTKGILPKIFGVSGVLAVSYCRRSKKKYQTTALSLFVSTVLFVLVSFFMDYLVRGVEQNFNENSYDVSFYFDTKLLEEGTQDAFFETLAQEEHITDATYTTSTKSFLAEINMKYLTQWALDNPGILTRPYRLKENVATTIISVTFVQDEAFRDLLQKYDLKEEDFMNPEDPKAIVLDGVLNASTNSSVELLNGDVCEVEFSRLVYKSADQGYTYLSEKLLYHLNGGKVIYERPYYIEAVEGLMFLYPESLRQYYIGYYEMPEEEKRMTKENDFSRLVEDEMYHCKFLSSDANATYEALRAIAEEHQLNVSNFANNADKIEKEENLLDIIEVLAMGFIVLMSLVAAINVFNTISVNIGLRRKEFAVLKSLGMTERKLNLMLFVECILLSGRALLYGLPVAFVGTLLVHMVASTMFDATYQFPWEFLLISIAAILIIVLASMFYIMGRRRKENVLEALRNENV